MRRSTKWLLSITLLAAMAVWLTTWSWSQNQGFKVVFCNIGQGDATLVSIGTTQLLMDGGPGRQVLACLERHLPLGDKLIEVVVASHPDADHIGGLIEVLNHYQVGKLISGPEGKDTEVYRKLLQEINKHRESGELQVSNLYSGDRLTFGPVQATVVWPERQWVADRLSLASSNPNGSTAVLGANTTDPDINDFSLVLHVQYGNFDLLINGDAESSVQDEELLTGLIPSDIEIMTEPHHGSRNGLLDEWLSNVSPQMTVISVGAKNRYGHPAPEILQRLQAAGVKVLRTDQFGDIVVESDGENWWVR